MALEGTYLTTGGLHELEEELDQLRSVRRQEVAERIQDSKEVGELENAEYEEAKNEQAFVEGRIQELEMMIANAVIIPDHTQADASSDVVELGSIVSVQMGKAKKADTYTIVGSTEASPTDGRISNESPLGKALLGRKAGDKAEFKTPSGSQSITIVSVR
ncbi:MAG: transcription elongation factor GreA [Chloroflexota bacterium]|nr:transcription elongation factor GreA [Chloroflexota bacterium]MDE2886331.1 transcription elongation factor GreA [Chloroflexota bacterium]